jgi:hypothetical protein
MLKKSYKKRFKSNIDVKDNNSRNIVLSSDITASSVADIIESILDINTLDDELEEDLQDYDREPIKLVLSNTQKHQSMGIATVPQCLWVLSFIYQPTLDLHIKQRH